MLQIAGFEADVDSKELNAERRRLDSLQVGEPEPMEIDSPAQLERGQKRKFDEVAGPRRVTIDMLLNDRVVDRVTFCH